MAEYTIILTAKITEQHHSTGHTRHFNHGELLGMPKHLQIVQYPGDPGCYLIYCAADGREMTDTYHETIDAAKDQAMAEFELQHREWRSA